VSVAALVLALSALPAADVTVDLDGVLLGSPTIHSGRVETHLLFGARGGMLFEVAGDARVGFDVGLNLEPLPRVRGTADVSSVALEGGLTAHGVVGWRFGARPLWLMPYGWAGPSVGLRLIGLNALDESRDGSHATWGLHAGGGLRLGVGAATLSAELGGGARERGPELVGLLSSGFWF
jgi:hypothetical protein